MKWIVLITLGLVLFYLVRRHHRRVGGAHRKASPSQKREIQPLLTESPPPRPKGPPPSGAANPREQMKEALKGLDEEGLQAILDAGVHLKEGVEDLIREELRRRQEEV